jgi:hypothetical protein
VPAGHGRGRPDDRVRTRLPASRGLPPRIVGTGPARARRPGAAAERQGQGTRRSHRLRSPQASSTRCATRAS